MARTVLHYVLLVFGLAGGVTLLGDAVLYGGAARADTSGSTTVYRWVDSQGVVHYSDHPSPSAERLQIPPAQTFHDPPVAAVPSGSVNIGTPPVCPYGYYDYAPYDCAPYGYYGPEWFVNSAFIGAGPWFRGPASFRGYVNSHYDPRHGYHGTVPGHGQRPDPRRPADHIAHFHGDEAHDGRGHVLKR
jgi:hypothetical protein